MIITIAGEGGAGKTTVAKILAQKLRFKHVSAGGIRREIATKHGITIDELNEIGKTELWTDKECDDYLVEIGKTEDNVVLDSWMAWYFIPNSFKIYLKVDGNVAAQRVFENQRPSERKQETVDAVYAMMQERFNNNVSRYKKWYSVDFTEKRHYDLILDTTQLNPEQVAEKIIAEIRETTPHSI